MSDFSFKLNGKQITKKHVEGAEAQSILMWAYNNKLKLTGGDFKLLGHDYQAEWLLSIAQCMTIIKGAQIGATEILGVVKTIHGQIYGKYPQGVLYLLPTRTDVIDFSKGRFATLISENDCIKRFVKDTDAANVKRVNKSMLYLRGAKASHKIEGMKATSSQLKNVPVDRVVYDEKDEMSPAMVRLADERMSHSSVQEKLNLSTPTIPGYGIDKDYKESDQRVWMIRCQKCNHDTCLELSFPECLRKTDKGVIRTCMKCGGEIHPFNGRWVARRPDVKDHVGYWISQLNSLFVNPAKILDEFHNPPDGNITEFYNSKLGMAHIDAENKLERRDVYACCGDDIMAKSEVRYQCAMGVDVGKMLHYVIGYPKNEKLFVILKVGRVTDFSDLHDEAKRFNVKCLVIDALPETRKAREFQAAESYKVFLCYYQDSLQKELRLDEEQGIIAVNRTEICDETHYLYSKMQILIPRKTPEIEVYAEEMCNIAKVLEEDEFTKSRKYKYKSLGPDHYRHATNYFKLACKDNQIIYQPQVVDMDPRIDMIANEWSPI